MLIDDCDWDFIKAIVEAGLNPEPSSHLTLTVRMSRRIMMPARLEAVKRSTRGSGGHDSGLSRPCNRTKYAHLRTWRKDEEN